MAGVLRLERGEINSPLKNVLIVDDHIDRYEWVLKDNSELGLRVTVGHTCVLWRSDKVTFEVQMKRHRIDEKAEKMVVPRGSSPQLYEIRLFENQR